MDPSLGAVGSAETLTSVQRRTLTGLIRPGQTRAVPADLAERLRQHVQAGLHGMAAKGTVKLSKQRLNHLDRCEGLFQSGMAGERPPFEVTFRTAAGTVLHKAIELQVIMDRPDPWSLAEAAARRLRDQGRFRAYWEAVGPVTRQEVLMEVVRGVEMFQGSFPPLRPLRSSLAPVTELWLEARFRIRGGTAAVIVSGCVDLMLNRPVPGRATRLILDLKSGRARPEHPQDMRLYALLHTLRFGVPPIRVATVFLSAGEWQSEEVDEETLFRTAGRVVEAARTAGELAAGRLPGLTGGVHCSWCPRRAACPAASRENGE
jgi:hypothetical protein